MCTSPFRARSRCALAVALAAICPVASAQLWSPTFVSRGVSAQNSIQNGPGGPILSDVASDGSFDTPPIPSSPVDHYADSTLDGFGAHTFAVATHRSTVDSDSFNLSLSDVAIAFAQPSVPTTSLAYSTYWLNFTIDEPTYVTLRASAWVLNPYTLFVEPGIGSAFAVLRHLQGDIVEQANFNGPVGSQTDLSVLLLLQPGQYELYGSASASAGSVGGPLDTAIECDLEVSLTIPSPGAAVTLALGALTLALRRR